MPLRAYWSRSCCLSLNIWSPFLSQLIEAHRCLKQRWHFLISFIARKWLGNWALAVVAGWVLDNHGFCLFSSSCFIWAKSKFMRENGVVPICGLPPIGTRRLFTSRMRPDALIGSCPLGTSKWWGKGASVQQPIRSWHLPTTSSVGWEEILPQSELQVRPQPWLFLVQLQLQDRLPARGTQLSHLYTPDP